MESYWEYPSEGGAAFKDPAHKDTVPSDIIVGALRKHIDDSQERMHRVIWDIILDNLERCKDHKDYKSIELFVHTLRKDIASVRKI
jgi:hypothetical protein